MSKKMFYPILLFFAIAAIGMGMFIAVGEVQADEIPPQPNPQCTWVPPVTHEIVVIDEEPVWIDPVTHQDCTTVVDEEGYTIPGHWDVIGRPYHWWLIFKIYDDCPGDYEEFGHLCKLWVEPVEVPPVTHQDCTTVVDEEGYWTDGTSHTDIVVDAEGYWDCPTKKGNLNCPWARSTPTSDRKQQYLRNHPQCQNQYQGYYWYWREHPELLH